MAQNAGDLGLTKKFTEIDTDNDGVLSEDEFLNSGSVKEQPKNKRDFRLFDFDTNSTLSLAEYRTIPDVVPRNQRGNIPDPIVDLIENRTGIVRKQWDGWDADSNSTLNEEEFTESQLTSVVPGLQSSTLQDWDWDEDGNISLGEVQQTIEVAYGLRTPHGDLVRFSNGRVANWEAFRALDKDSDRYLTLEESLARNWDGNQTQLRFQESDTNQDKLVSVKEWAAQEYRSRFPIEEFVKADINLDGAIDTEESLNIGPDPLLSIRRYLQPAFDRDGDGKLSLNEYRLSPLANPVHPWHVPRQDTNDDGFLELREFRWDDGIAATALYSEYFDRYDLNDDNLLDLDEFTFTTTYQDPVRDFSRLDTDGDELLVESEFVRDGDAARQAMDRRDFVVFDFDWDQKLSYEEYLRIPTRVKIQHRESQPNALLGLVATRMQQIETGWSDYDSDGNGTLNPAEYRKCDLARSQAGLELSRFSDWDRNGDGEVSKEDARKFLEVACGITTEDGKQLVGEFGIVHHLQYFEFQDKDKDGVLSQAEYAVMGATPEKGQEEFLAADVNKSGSLDWKEWTSTRPGTVNTLAVFLAYDADVDGWLSQEDLREKVWSGRQSLVDHLLPGFDTDGDGVLSLAEYQVTPFATPFVAWRVQLADRNNDGRLSREEFRWSNGWELAALYAEYFDRYDLDDDDQLDLDEFTFTTTYQNPARDFHRLDTDDDEFLVEAEFVRDVDVARQSLDRRDFVVFDSDGNQKLSYEEYLRVPARVKMQHRKSLPNVLLGLVDIRMQQIEAAWLDYDSDGNGTLNSTDYRKCDLARSQTGLELSGFSDWDRDGDGEISKDDARKFLELACGITTEDGKRLVGEFGIVHHLQYFEYQDKNKDGLLSQAEYAVMGATPEKGREEFLTADVDNSGSLDWKEWTSTRPGAVNTIAEFLGYDADVDGRLSQEDLREKVWSGRQSLVDHLLPGFDADGDGLLNLSEYQMTPFATPFVAWRAPLTDRNNDGRLSREEFRWSNGWELAALYAEYFKRYDLNDDDLLDLDEFTFTTTYQDPARDFRKLDTDDDEFLVEAEFVRDVDAAQQSLDRRDFVVFDFDRDQKLNYEEYLRIPNRVEIVNRGNLPNPLQGLVATRMRKIEAGWSDYDGDGNGTLNAPEYRKCDLARSQAGLELSGFSDWDRDGNGEVSKDDARKFLELACGITTEDGKRLVGEFGIVHHLQYFEYQDKNKDGVLSRAEYVVMGATLEKGQEEFFAADVDKSDSIDWKEWTATRPGSVNTLAEFFAYDADVDGRLSHQDLREKVWSGRQSLVNHLLPGFDTDGDGVLSLAEYQVTPFAAPFVAWRAPLTDRNNDGRLSREEFRWSDGWELAALYAEYFDRYDLNDDDLLDLDEFTFTTTYQNPARDFRRLDTDGDEFLAEPEFVRDVDAAQQSLDRRDFVVFDFDRDQKLSYEEYLRIPTRVKVLNRGSLPNALQGLVDTRMQKIEAAWSNYDGNGNGTLNAAEYRNCYLARHQTGLELSEFSDWDHDGDGEVSRDDARKFLEVACGITTKDGKRLIGEFGIVYHLQYFEFHDKDKDGVLSSAEFVVMGATPKKGQEEFLAFDVDKSGSLDWKEWTLTRPGSVNTLAEFFAYDADVDGRLSQEDLREKVWSGRQSLVDHLLPGFDVDGDGVLSLSEYQVTPFATPFVAWRAPPTDRNNDGRLSREEFRWSDGWELAALYAEHFDRYDLNDDDLLGLDEFTFTTSYQDPARDFRRLDADDDEFLVEAEFVRDVDAAQQATDRRDFVVFDTDGNHKLSYEEYLRVPARVKMQHRESLPNALLGLVDIRMQQIEAAWSDYDGDGNGTLNAAEYRNCDLARSQIGLELSGFSDWDRDGDGEISKDDARKFLEVACGITTEGGKRLVGEFGIVHHLQYFEFQDKDKDGVLSRAEYVVMGATPEKGREEFLVADIDKSGSLDWKEWISTRPGAVNTIAEFLGYDADVDGRLSQEDLREKVWSGRQSLVDHLLPGFDVDDDGLLSLAEYQVTPFAAPFVAWRAPLTDRNNDGRLSREEFRWSDGWELAALYAEYFKRYDLNGDHLLGLDEFTFNIDLVKVPSRIAFLARDANVDGAVSLDEALVDYDAADENAQIAIALIEDAFRAADSNGDGNLTLREFRSGDTNVMLRPGAPKKVSIRVAAGRDAPDSRAHWRQWLIVGLNVVVVAAIGIYLIRKG